MNHAEGWKEELRDAGDGVVAPVSVDEDGRVAQVTPQHHRVTHLGAGARVSKLCPADARRRRGSEGARAYFVGGSLDGGVAAVVEEDPLQYERQQRQHRQDAHYAEPTGVVTRVCCVCCVWVL